MSDQLTISFRMKLRAISQVFGTSWLNGTSGKPHPVRKNYQAIKPLIVALSRDPSATLPSDLSTNDSFTHLDALGTTLNYTMDAPGFDRQIAARMLKPSEYNGALFEARVASYHAKRYLDVRFIGEPSNGPTGPDLRVVAGGKSIVIEAKYKDRIVPAVESKDFKILQRQLNERGAAECPSGIDVTVIYLGVPNERSYLKCFDSAMKIVREGYRGTRFVSDSGLWLTVSERTPLAAPVTETAILESIEGRAASLHFTRLPHGGLREVEGATFGIFTLPGHTIEGIMQNIERASTQIGKGGIGVVYIDVDSMGRSINDLGKYLGLLLKGVEKRTWGGGRNSRIRALVLSCGPIASIEMDGSHKVKKLLHPLVAAYHSDIVHSPNDVDARTIIERIVAHNQEPAS